MRGPAASLSVLPHTRIKVVDFITSKLNVPLHPAGPLSAAAPFHSWYLLWRSSHGSTTTKRHTKERLVPCLHRRAMRLSRPRAAHPTVGLTKTSPATTVLEALVATAAAGRHLSHHPVMTPVGLTGSSPPYGTGTGEAAAAHQGTTIWDSVPSAWYVRCQEAGALPEALAAADVAWAVRKMPDSMQWRDGGQDLSVWAPRGGTAIGHGHRCKTCCGMIAGSV